MNKPKRILVQELGWIHIEYDDLFRQKDNFFGESYIQVNNTVYLRSKIIAIEYHDKSN